MNFDTAFERLIGHEGGLVDHPSDPGGLTKYGISQRSYPGEDIRNLTLARAKVIYKRDFWGPAGCDTVPAAVKFDLFDMAVNAGVRKAVQTLQRALNETPDGILGPRTIQAAQNMDPGRLLARFNGWRLDHLNDLPAWPAFGKGWTQRIADNLKAA